MTCDVVSATMASVRQQKGWFPKYMMLNYSDLRTVYVRVECFGEYVDVVVCCCRGDVVALAAIGVAVAV